MKAKSHWAYGLGFLLLTLGAYAQSSPGSLSIPVENLPAPSLWKQYLFRLPAAGGVGRYHWRVVNGPLPPGLKLSDDGELSGIPQETGQFNLILQVTDSDSPSKQLQKRFTL